MTITSILITISKLRTTGLLSVKAYEVIYTALEEYRQRNGDAV